MKNTSLVLYFTFYFFTIAYFQRIYMGVNLEGQLTQNWRVYLYMHFFLYKYPFDTSCHAKYRFRSIFYFLVCLYRAIFKEFIGAQTRGSKKVKKRSINSKLENLPMDAFFHYR